MSILLPLAPKIIEFPEADIEDEVEPNKEALIDPLVSLDPTSFINPPFSAITYVFSSLLVPPPFGVTGVNSKVRSPLNFPSPLGLNSIFIPSSSVLRFLPSIISIILFARLTSEKINLLN